ncbi:cardiolipin synthase [Brumimicrobium salinarum]|uniref:cardiolipin synthase n=1 Tax=Brumimicrobium salinarum TaxID=2058658 RepID=UPI0029370C40|nr:cardiolipin synthase [Brumimicrobium salinarum]
MIALWITLQIIYVIVVIIVCMRIINDTQSFAKSLAYLLLVVLVPIFGVIFYLSFGINYRKRKMYSKKLIKDKTLSKQLEMLVLNYAQTTFEESKPILKDYKKLINMITNDTLSSISDNNQVKLLFNGEEKFPKVLESIAQAKHHIHIEYYIFENDKIGNQIIDLLIEKAKEGVEVRFIYDDYGSRGVRGKLVKKLRKAGVKAFPFHRVIFIYLANRLNYRNHRKIIIIDGQEAFIGGINVSDKYINASGNNEQMYWRDTHLYIKGAAVYFLQHTFMCDWNFCAKDELELSMAYFPLSNTIDLPKEKIVQIVSSGPDSRVPTILYSQLQIINLAKEEVLITTPYFIPGEGIIDALVVAALGGVKVKLLVPGVSDSKLVNAAARSYYKELLAAGVEIYTYQKGFVHAKTAVADKKVAVVGTANMDYRSFDLNFEVNAIVYDDEIAQELTSAFYKDLAFAHKIDYEIWKQRSQAKKC